MIPLAILTIIQKTSAFWASILGYFLVGDKLSRIEISGLFIGFFGIFLIMDSEFNETKNDA
jgi:drug/metabolite transporter (DMT)-like permease